MKANVIKQLHELGVYRDPSTKQKLENMKLADILSVMSYVQEEIEKGADFGFQWSYELAPTKDVQKLRDKEEMNYFDYAVDGYNNTFTKFVDSQK